MVVVQTPDWVKHAVFYQIFPDRFAKGKVPHSLIPEDRLEPWYRPPTLQGYKGGNFWGIIEQLDYLQDLGITAIYFTPIFQSASNHRYHTHDYYQVDPLLGGNAAFFKFLDAAHQRNLKVVLDGVFNHCSRGFFFFNDILENGPYSPWLEWFKVEAWPVCAYDGSQPANYASWIGNRALPEFNHNHPQVQEYIYQVAEHWIKAGIDGWRLDVPFEIKTPGFWQLFRQRVKAINPEAYIVGEVWRDSRQWLAGDQFDGVMNYLFTGPTLAFTAGDRVDMELVAGPDYYPYPALDAAGYAHKIQELLNLYAWEIQLAQLNLLSSHDVARVLSVVGGDRTSFELATLLLLTFPGAPSIYYGDEVGLAGGLDPDSRRSFPDPQDWDHAYLDLHRHLIQLRHTHPALRVGQYRVLAAEGQVYVFSRSLAADVIVVAINASMDVASLELADPGNGQLPTVLYGAGSVHQLGAAGETGDRWQLKLPARNGLILQTQTASI